jgi:hypothetical protein
MDELQESLAEVPAVHLVNVDVPRSWEGEVNDQLAEAVGEWPEATLLDWHGIAASDGDLTYDGVHLTPEGQKAYTDLITGAVSGGVEG